MTKENIITFILSILFIDFVCMLAWAMSGQQPQTTLYFGVISTEAIRFLFF